MRKMYAAYIVLAFSTILPKATAQQGWDWTPLANMPVSVANNAVTGAEHNNQQYMFSFCGIDSTKTPQGINLGAYRYNISSNQWTTLPDVPDTMGKIAAGASEVNGIIYVIGGYHVFPDFHEVSSNKVHRFDVAANQWLSDGAPIPVAIDDHIQAVWRDSLIYVVTGWSNTTNVPNVQIYNPALDQWSVGTSTPNNNNYKAFGASGTIIGDTIFYNGGASLGINFPGRKHLRRGIIDPNNPTTITWDLVTDNPGDAGYRMAASSYQNTLLWFGGSGTTYNFDGIAYNGSGGVEPLTRTLGYNTQTATWGEMSTTPEQVMDLRGIAHFGSNQWWICGGMGTSQSVHNKTFRITLQDTAILGVSEHNFRQQLLVYPNPGNGAFQLKLFEKGTFYIYNSAGAIIKKENIIAPTDKTVYIETPGVYVMVLEGVQNLYQTRVVVAL